MHFLVFGAGIILMFFLIVLSVQGYLLLSSLYRGAYGLFKELTLYDIYNGGGFVLIKFYFCLFSD